MHSPPHHPSLVSHFIHVITTNSSLFLYCLQTHINITVPTDTTSIITTLRTMASIMAAATASSSTSLRATPFLGQSRTSANALKDVVPMGNAKYTMVISW